MEKMSSRWPPKAPKGLPFGARLGRLWAQIGALPGPHLGLVSIAKIKILCGRACIFHYLNKCVLRRPRWAPDAPQRLQRGPPSGLCLGASGLNLRHFEAIWGSLGPSWAYLGFFGANLGPFGGSTWVRPIGEDGLQMAPKGSKGASLWGLSWAPLDSNWGIAWAPSWPRLEIKILCGRACIFHYFNKCVLRRPRWAPDAPQRLRRGLKMAPRPPQEAPRWPQGAPRGSKRTPK